MTPMRWVRLVLALLAVALLALFWQQNSLRESMLSLDLFFFGFQLASPQPVPTLVLAAAGVGLAIGGSWGLVQYFASARRIRELEDRLARASLTTGNDDWT